ncbi:MAG: alpha/beta fold hydrolase [Dehalococcoidia bacterium]|nr:alpha/beta fold hydrolase [Dehalococcoidia bacterium]
MLQSEIVATSAGHIEVLREPSRDPRAVLLPGGAGGISAYSDFLQQLADAGIPTAGLNPRGCGRSTGLLEAVRLHDIARDFAEAIQALSFGPLVVMGHAGGNRIARMLATWHPETVSGIVLIAAGGIVLPQAEAATALRTFMAPDISPEKRRQIYRDYFLAPGHSSLVDAASVAAPDQSLAFGRAFATAMSAIPNDAWSAGGDARMLVVQGLQDRIAPPENGRALAERYPDRVTLVEIDNAGHALYLEQPQAIVAAIRNWLAGP